MFNSQSLEVMIGVVFVFILISVMCTSVREIIEGIFKTRASYLEYGLRELLQDVDWKSGLAQAFYNHPLIFGLFSGDYNPKGMEKQVPRKPWAFTPGANLPSYIPSKSFALALLDLAARGAPDKPTSAASSAPLTLDMVRANIANIPSPSLQRAVLTAIDTAGGDFDKARQNVEDWFNASMDRVSGWYKRSTSMILFVIALTITIGCNINVINIASYLNQNSNARQALVNQAQIAMSAYLTDASNVEAAVDKALANQKTMITGAPSSGTQLSREPLRAAAAAETVKTVNAALTSMPIPVGWDGFSLKGDSPLSQFGECLMILLGWALTAAAATLGAPFWFDVLNKLMVIRSTVKPNEKSLNEASEDRQAGASQGQPTVVQVAQAAGPNQAAQQPGDPAPPSPGAVDPGDQEAGLDACGVDVATPTDDEALPVATGG